MNELPKPFWSRDLRPAIDALLDLIRLDLVRVADTTGVWTLLKTDQEAFEREVKRLEQAAL